ncbi:LysR family transcriptional regulator [Actinomadura sp. DC4]|uniref:LysR family transcriptional regulator n=1 Tax=Actinomadura sp. DC4 TaxID=3055069 RepID=UPI0025AEDAA2|nr:LysR family transcriptional regulator [Actinomadura sp. DC4]MDN3360046.1 LysR family transcriptional regulator [Actinomadura sp. DC4]
MTLTQLSVFVLVARLGSVKAAARTLDVSEPAVSQALSALRQHLGDQLVTRGPSGMTLTPGGTRLLGIASQMVALGAEAEATVRAAQGAPEPLRIVASSTVAEFVSGPLIDAFVTKSARKVDGSSGVATTDEMPVLVANRLSDLALGPSLRTDPSLVSEPVLRTKLIVVGSARHPLRSDVAWLVDPAGTDPESDTGRLLRRLRVPDSRIRVFPNQTAAWTAAADGAGVAPAFAHLVAPQLRRGDLVVITTPATPMATAWYATTMSAERRSATAGAFRRFLGTPDAMHIMQSAGTGSPPSRFRPPVYVTIWS